MGAPESADGSWAALQIGWSGIPGTQYWLFARRLVCSEGLVFSAAGVEDLVTHIGNGARGLYQVGPADDHLRFVSSLGMCVTLTKETRGSAP